jgi:hypothetical protein
MAQDNERVTINEEVEGRVHFEVELLEGWTAITIRAALNDGRAKWEPETSAITLLGSDKPIAKITHYWPSQFRGDWEIH